MVAASGQTLTGPELRSAVDDVADKLAALPPGVLLAAMPVTLTAVLRYLGALRAGRAIALIDPSRPPDPLVTCFRPAAVLGADPLVNPPAGYAMADVGGPAWTRRDPEGVTPHRDLAVLLPTSGSTGRPQFVRLSRAAVLRQRRADRRRARHRRRRRRDHHAAAVLLVRHVGTALHLLRGATVVLERTGLLSSARSGRRWSTPDHLDGVRAPQYRMLRRLRFDPAEHPALRTLTQAGGRLPTERVTEFAERWRPSAAGCS